MAIKWSAVKVNDAMDMAEEFVKEAAFPLAQAKLVAREARNLPNLPQYMEDRLIRLIGQIDRMDNVRSAIEAIREDIPQADLEEQRKQAEYGSQQSLV